MVKSVTLNPGEDGAAMAILEDAEGDSWIPAVICYATSTTDDESTFQFVNASNGMPVSVIGTVPVSGTFFQATQPVSIASTVGVTQSGSWSITIGAALPAGTNVIGHVIVDSGAITANAGTNLNTSALALETGGNLATIAGRTPALGQALAAASVPVVLTAIQVAALTPLTTLPTVTTVGTLTSITNALPAGTNLLGQVGEAPSIAAALNGTTPVTVEWGTFTTSSSGPDILVAGVSGKRVYLLRWSVSANGTTNVNLQSHATTTTATGLRYLTQFASAGGAYCPLGIMATAVGEGLDVNNSNAVAISGEYTYVQF